MTDKTDPIAHATRLLREAAQELQQGHTLRTTPNDWTGEPEAKAAYDEHMGAAAALECWAEAIGAGGVSPLMGKPQEMPDLTTLTERGAKAWAGVDAQGLREGVASAGSEPVARVNDDGFIVEIGDLLLAPGQKLYLHPSPPEGMAGWKWVPVEPTEEMLSAAHDGDREYTLRNFGDVMTVMQGPYDHWAAMIAAAPHPPTTSAGSGKGE